MKSFVAIDFETANQYRSSICSVGLVFVEQGKIVDKLYQLIKPTPNFYCDWATEIHGISYWDTYRADEFPAFWREVSPRLAQQPLVAHNKAFDESCLRAVLEHYDLDAHQNPFYCTYRKAREVLPQLENHQLHTVSSYLGFDLENHHHALADAEACAYIAMKIF